MSTTNDELNLMPGNVKAAVAGANSADLWMVDRRLIRRHPKLQPRDKNTPEYKNRVQFLKGLIMANGYDRAFPLKLYVARENGEDVLYLVQGHRRLDAVDLACEEGKEIEKIPCVTTERGTTMADLLISTVTGNEGEQLRPIETAGIVRELIKMNFTEDEIARRLNFSRTYITNLLDMLEAPRAVREMIQEGQVAAAVALNTVREHGENAITALQAGLEVAKSKGKDKVTPKHLRAAGYDKSKPSQKKDSDETTKAPPAPATQGQSPAEAGETNENAQTQQEPQGSEPTAQKDSASETTEVDLPMAIGKAVLGACKLQIENGRSLDKINLQAIVERAVRKHAQA